MSDYTNYGTELWKMSVSGSEGSATIVAGVVKIDPPEITMSMINTTNHSSGSFMQQIPSGNTEVGDFTVTLAYSGSVVSALYDSVTSGSLGYWKISFRNGQSCYFDAYPNAWTPEGTDAQSPEMSMVTVGFAPTGTILIS